MERINKSLHRLEKLLTLTKLDVEDEYVLTPEEELIAIENAIASAIKYEAWKKNMIFKTKEEIEFKLSQINWEEYVNRKQVLRTANAAKLSKIWHQQKRIQEKEEEKKKLEEIKKSWNAEAMYRYMSWVSQNRFRRKLEVNKYNHEMIKALCFFLSEDERFETDLGHSFKKGLLFRGISGVGKTYLSQCLEQNGFNPILILSMVEISDEVRMSGNYTIEMNGNKKLYLDDVGSERQDVKNYGSVIAFFKDFIETTYLRRREAGYGFLIISTNYSFDQIEEKYGFRVRRRMGEMFNVIDVKGGRYK